MFRICLLEEAARSVWIGAGVGDKLGTLPFWISNRDDESNFILTRETAEAVGMRRIEVPVTTLNEIVRTSDAPFPDMVKIDCGRGLISRVIAGASELLGKTEVFLLEAVICAVTPGHVFENTLANVVQTMGNAGYRVIDITDLNRSRKYGALWLCELAFLSNTSHLLDGIDSARLAPCPRRLHGLRKLFCAVIEIPRAAPAQS